MVRALSKVKLVGVVDRSVSFGWNSGPLHQEVLAALYHARHPIPAPSFIGGLAGSDLTVKHFRRVIAETANAAWQGPGLEPVWLNAQD